MKKSIIAISCICANILMAENTFTLGEILVSDTKNKVLETNKIELEKLEDTSKKDIASILDEQTGLTLISRGGRGEKAISIRGSHSSRTGVFLDGIPIYVPFDGQFDYSRILTTQLSSVQVAKGFSSSSYGVNTSAGVINLVSKKPQKEFEGSISSQINLDNSNTKSSTINSIDLGTKQDKYYIQLSGTIEDRDHYNVSNDFISTSSQSKGERQNSSAKQKSINLKVGLTPTDESEYVFGYSYLDSQKEQPIVTNSSLNNEKFWEWPKWNKDTIYFISNNKLSSGDIKFKIYKDSYDNKVLSFKDATFTGNPGHFDYEDYTLGANLEYTNHSIFDDHILKAGINYKKDSHKGEEKKVKNNGSEEFNNDKYVDEIYSIYAEDSYYVNDKLMIVTSASYDYAKPKTAITSDTQIHKDSNNAINPQIGLFYDINKDSTTRFTISRKTNLPTMKQRFSDKRGKALTNPYLDPETVMHYEVGHNIKKENLSFDTAVFYTKITDPITIVPNVSGSKGQEQNTGEERYKGLEFTLNYKLNRLDTGFNYTYLNSNKDDEEKVTEIPKHQVYIYANYALTNSFQLSANYTHKYGIIAQNGISSEYTRLNTIKLVNLNTKYIYSKNMSFNLGVDNLFDRNYEYDLGYPEMGREIYLKAKYTF
ncbi:TonB-dependent receptor plug domain-containing protein [Arcobacter sp. YIC-464]|uniref:TonB-dependent receptor plug domain-containing protein n=1 Tax=Arcobacter sp. YIC-464 TaxID=3376631 RepID=UPI003C282170